MCMLGFDLVDSLPVTRDGGYSNCEWIVVVSVLFESDFVALDTVWKDSVYDEF